MKSSLCHATALAAWLALGACQGSEDQAPAQPKDPALAYQALCAGCHAQEGQGDGQLYPPLKGHIPQLLSHEGGRAYLLNVPVHGLMGKIEVQGKAYEAEMAPLQAARPEDIAQALNHVTQAWGHDAKLPADFKAYQPEEVTAARMQSVRSYQVRGMRPDLSQAPPAPPAQGDEAPPAPPEDEAKAPEANPQTP